MKKNYLLLTTISLICFAASVQAQTVPSYVPTTGLVGWWPFSGNAIDSSGNANNGTVNSALLTTDRNGNLNKAYSFNGTTSYISLPTTMATAFAAGRVTGAAWVFFTANSSWATVIKNWGSLTTGAYHFGLSDITQKMQLEVTQSNGTTVFITAPTVTSLNVWHHVAFTADGSFLRLYQDGVQVGTAVSYNGTLSTAFQYTNMGAKPGTNSVPASYPGYLNGKLDDIGLWSTALTPQQILALYNASQPTAIANLSVARQIKIYPNPSGSFVQIETANKLGNASVKLFDVAGKEVVNETFAPDSYQLSISSLSSGVYFIEVMDNEVTWREKVVKK